MDGTATTDPITETITGAIGAHLVRDLDLRDEILGSVEIEVLHTVARRLVLGLVGALELLGPACGMDSDEFVRAFLVDLAARQT